jgi:hypothetical protein
MRAVARRDGATRTGLIPSGTAAFVPAMRDDTAGSTVTSSQLMITAPASAAGAWAALVNGVRQLPAEPALPAAGRVTRVEADARLRLGSAFPSAFRRRGPPLAVQT